jgi:putative transposon-encoded protein
MDSIKMEITGYQVLEKRVMKHGNGAHLLVPVAWVGRRCKIILLEDADIPVAELSNTEEST